MDGKTCLENRKFLIVLQKLRLIYDCIEYFDPNTYLFSFEVIKRSDEFY